MSTSDAERWNAKYSEQDAPETEPVPFLVDSISQLGSGTALDLAAGCGRNAVYLAEQGFDVTALDVSTVGLEQCRRLAEERGVSINTVCADLDEHDLGRHAYDLITKIYFYEPSLFANIRGAIRPGGYFLFQTFSEKHADVGTFGPRNPAYLASKDVVLNAFTKDKIHHCEEVVLTDDEDTEAVLQLIVQIR